MKKTISIAVIGPKFSGKTTWVNALLNRSIPAATAQRMHSFFDTIRNGDDVSHSVFRKFQTISKSDKQELDINLTDTNSGEEELMPFLRTVIRGSDYLVFVLNPETVDSWELFVNSYIGSCFRRGQTPSQALFILSKSNTLSPQNHMSLFAKLLSLAEEHGYEKSNVFYSSEDSSHVEEVLAHIHKQLWSNEIEEEIESFQAPLVL